MKKKLLLIILPIMLISLVIQAQEKVWDFGNDTTNWPESSAAITTTTVIDGLTLEPGENGANFGVIDANNTSWDDGYSATQRFKFGGNSGVNPADGDFIPTRRFLKFSIDGPVSVKIWFRASGGGTPRALYITDGSATVAHYDSTGDTGPQYLEADYSGDSDELYILCADNAFNLYKIEVSSTLLSINDFATTVSSNIRAVGSTVYVSNVKATTEVNIYSITGALVNSFKTNNDTSFEFNSGLYIATLKTPEGQKSVKMIVR